MGLFVIIECIQIPRSIAPDRKASELTSGVNSEVLCIIDLIFRVLDFIFQIKFKTTRLRRKSSASIIRDTCVIDTKYREFFKG